MNRAGPVSRRSHGVIVGERYGGYIHEFRGESGRQRRPLLVPSLFSAVPSVPEVLLGDLTTRGQLRCGQRASFIALLPLLVARGFPFPRRYIPIPTEEHSPVRRASVTMPEVSKLHMVVSGLFVISSPHSLALSSHYCLAPPAPRLRLVVPPKSRWKQVLVNVARWSLETINTLPDDVLLEIFHFCVNLCGIRTNGWHTLVHNALWRPFRIRSWADPPHSYDISGLRNCPVRGIPKLLLSANRLVRLHLWEIPDFGYISPQELGTALSAMSRLETFYLGFQSPLYSESRPRSPLARSVFPALTRLVFKGAQEYLENLMAQIEAPLLEYILMNLRRIPVNHEMTPSSHTQRFHDPTTAIHTPTNS
ncbi:hypothetical protein F5148DRAFT_1153570 [Russula earlei]|uniref:Uncharacterized protein n=1 Tax=Russula earlei TaxID=71964 RepID=A0ACC0TUM4_9AGAM|nr:hypothetical protein F5148DRAFT_1153570 [Russula earlei]